MKLKRNLVKCFRYFKNIFIKDLSEKEKLFISRATNTKLNISCRVVAIKQITHQKTLYELASYDEDHRVRKEATKRISKEKYLKNIIEYNDKPIVRALAVRNLKNNNKFLLNIVFSEEEPIVIRAALQTMDNIETLEKVINSQLKDEYKKIAKDRIKLKKTIIHDFWI